MDLEELERQQAIEAEENRQKLVSELTTKLEQTPQNAVDLSYVVQKTYDEFVHNEEQAKKAAKKFQIPYKQLMDKASMQQLVEEIRAVLESITNTVDNTTIDEQMNLEDAEKLSKDLMPKMDGVSYGVEVAQAFTELVELNKEQIDETIKKGVYGRVQEVLQSARMQKYEEQRASIQSEKIGFFGKLFGQEKLKVARLRNLDLKMQLAQRAETQEKENYNITEMLVDMRICANTELDGVFTPEMQELYDNIKDTYRDTRMGKFSEQYINGLANQKLARERKCYGASCSK